MTNIKSPRPIKGAKLEKFSTQLFNYQREKLRHLAYKNKTSIGQIVRKIVEDYINGETI